LLHHRLNEFAILIIAHDSGSQYEWYAHYPLAIKAGLDEKVAAELAEGKRPSGMRDDEVLVYDFSTQLHHKHNVDDATYKAAVAKLGEQGAWISSQSTAITIALDDIERCASASA
jgi:4-carboxymuconolactone decarboxylase